MIPMISDEEYASAFVSTILHVLGGEVTRTDVLFAIAFRVRPNLLIDIATQRTRVDAEYWSDLVSARPISVEIFESALRYFSTGVDSRCRDTICQPLWRFEDLDDWFLFEVNLILDVMFAHCLIEGFVRAELITDNPVINGVVELGVRS